ncbi:uncharacterized protein LOC103695549 isoform X2 [Phoenix dactylifera]|uniref:Uncharacterized protein LOC103695549 isoform X2 n=1 Tax=Phoenix dactylifera TaxID=42345 RepID=A0A8B9A0G1_PHODC|nr:uncharacterized protein LOC103695549 isoform X2 [Phoenix dactylifera]
MATLKGSHVPPLRSFPFHPFSLPTSSRPSVRIKKPVSTWDARAFCFEIPKKVRVLRPRGRASGGGGGQAVLRSGSEEAQRPPFDINLAVVLAGFAFDSYTSPPKDVGWREIDAADCQTVFLSKQFLREVYDGQLYIKLKKGEDFPAMDPWGTSDPYVILQIDGQVTKSKVKWGTREPIWNEDFTLNIKTTPAKTLQVVAWDANLVTPHKRMGNAAVNLESLCDGNLHEMVVELEGIGGGGKIYLEIKYRSYDEIEEDKQWWRVPFISDFLTKSSLESAIKMVLGSESVNVSQFVQLAFGQLKPFNYAYLWKPSSSDGDNDGSKCAERSLDAVADSKQVVWQSSSSESSGHNASPEKENNLPVSHNDANVTSSSLRRKAVETAAPAEYFWKAFADIINQTVWQKLGFSIPEIRMWDGFDLLHRGSLQLRKTAEEEYVESGLASPETEDENDRKRDPPSTTNGTPLLDIKKVSWNVLSQTEAIFRAMMVLTATLPQEKRNSSSGVEEEDKEYSMNKVGGIAVDGFPVDTQKAEEMRELFSSAESAMEAWAMLATSFGRKSFIKSDFEKICFLDNFSTDTQVAIWRDSLRRRLVIAFRGTEQAKWKDLRTDLMLVPAGLNPERLGGDFKQEVQVHSGFLNAYDSVRNRIITLIKVSIGSSLGDDLESMPKWHVYVTGHSLGGALATLLALELSSSQMARVGNRRFAELYNEKVKDSWRVVNHRDIIPTVPRLMGYCHVAQPVYLAAGDLEETLVNKIDGYQGDAIGEFTPDILVSEFMKGEKQLVEKILQTEINLLSTIRDGTALMQHMEDFYYITLLESVRANYQRTDSSSEEGCQSTVMTFAFRSPENKRQGFFHCPLALVSLTSVGCSLESVKVGELQLLPTARSTIYQLNST